MYHLEFNNTNYPIREINLPEYGNVMIATTSLNDVLMDNKGSYVSYQAEQIDEQIYFFVEDEKIVLEENEIVKVLLAEVL